MTKQIQGAQPGPDGLTLSMPASFPGAAKHLVHRLAQLVDKCRPGYCVSKGVRDQIEECHAVASATVFAIEHQPVAVPAPEGAPAARSHSYLAGHADGLEWAACLVAQDDPRTGDWMHDDRSDLAAAIRKGPEMPDAEPLCEDQATWCGYVAGMVGAYLGIDTEDERIPVMAKVIERRLWALPPLAAQPQADDADVRELSKWLNEEPNRPIDRQALVRVLAALAAQPAPACPYYIAGPDIANGAYSVAEVLTGRIVARIGEPAPAEGDAEPSYAGIRALIANLQRLEDPAQTELPTLDGVDGRALVGKCWRGLDWLLGQVDDLEVAKDEAERAPWPDWANQVLKVVREFSGYDGYDDADGVDIAEEVGECLRELAADAKRARDALAASKVQPKGTDAKRYRLVHKESGELHRLIGPTDPFDLDSWEQRECRVEVEPAETQAAFLDDVYQQCCEAIKPLVEAGQLPGSVVESLQMLVAEKRAALQAPAPADGEEQS